MRHLLHFEPGETRPHAGAVLARMHVPAGAPISAALSALLDEARAAYDGTASPVALFEAVSHDEFERVYAGAGHNQPRTPVPAIARRARARALFAGTLGAEMDAALTGAFRRGNTALGCVLDTYASIAAERLADLAAARFRDAVSRGRGEQSHVLPYSPGYCGWHVSGQAALFERLRPSEIGITLNPSSLMSPIKSVSGVLLAAPREAHRFRPDFPFCDHCASRECLDRMRALRTSS